MTNPQAHNPYERCQVSDWNFFGYMAGGEGGGLSSLQRKGFGGTGSPGRQPTDAFARSRLERVMDFGVLDGCETLGVLKGRKLLAGGGA